jgi:hypothetical protein
MEGTRPNAYDYGGPPAPTGPALPNLINAVRMFKIKIKTALANAEINKLANAEINKLANAEINKLANAEIKKLTLILTLTY